MSTGAFQGAHHFSQYKPTLIDTSTHNYTSVLPSAERSGIQILLEHSTPDAFHDSSARYPPPKCHPGTREEIVNQVIRWGKGKSGAKPILWIHGPAGVGKSAVAQSSAEAFTEEDWLGAAFFFSRPNKRYDPNRLFTSISYKLASKIDPYRKLIDEQIRKDPTVVSQSINNQFRELLVKPLKKLQSMGTHIEGWVIIVDGLDECEGTDAQHDIISLITTSAKKETTPFRWMLLSRSEPGIVAAFEAAEVASSTLRMHIPISREIDHEIMCFLMAELMKIGKTSRLPPSWPSDRDLQTLVDLSAGLFAYAATIVRFIGKSKSAGPATQLQAVLALAGRRKVADPNPLAPLDALYTLIMESLPQEVLPTIQKIILRLSLRIGKPGIFSRDIGFLDVSDPQVEYACATLHSVMECSAPNSFGERHITFYHASFTDYIMDPNRSGRFCVLGECLDGLRRDALEQLLGLNPLPSDQPETIVPINEGADTPYHKLFQVLAELYWLDSDRIRDFEQLINTLLDFDFNGVLRVLILHSHANRLVGRRAWKLDLQVFSRRIMPASLKRLVRPCRNPFKSHSSERPSKAVGKPYVIGHGNKKILCWQSSDPPYIDDVVTHPDDPTNRPRKFILAPYRTSFLSRRKDPAACLEVYMRL